MGDSETVITGPVLQVLRALGPGPENALTATLIWPATGLPGTSNLQQFLRRLARLGLAARERRASPSAGSARAFGPDNGAPFWYWRTDLGNAVLAMREGPCVEGNGDPPDTDPIMDPANQTRGARTFRTAMHAFGLCTLTQYKALRGADRWRFELAWSALMYEAAGLPQSQPYTHPPTDPCSTTRLSTTSATTSTSTTTTVATSTASPNGVPVG